MKLRLSPYILTATLLAVLSGCAGTAGSPDYVKQKLTEKYVGQRIDVVVADFGAPENTTKLATGATVYTWKRQTDKYKRNIFIKSDERCVITMLSDEAGKTIKAIGKVDDSLGAYEVSYCAEQYEL